MPNTKRKTKTLTVDQYIAAREPRVRRALRRVRSIVRKAMPAAEEVISYQIPAYRLDGRIVLFFAGWKEHFSIYPAIGGLAEALAKDLEPYEVKKGTIRFPLSEPVPERLIAKIAKYRVKQAAALARTSRETPKARAKRKSS
ncbi:MAG TPA: DUF1801 domain-containing protein [Polyangiales bacterium]|jgi:uncharacterized protein YdhG (YjbR/CyaY superfamily)|nr:DUF1801 domain-containing protein [Polyangiales bacterium]